jgi:hypothetical protein
MLQQFLTQVIAEIVLHQRDYVALDFLKDHGNVSGIAFFNLLLQVAAAVLILG